MSLARQHDTLQLGVGQLAFHHHALRKHRTIRGRRVRHGGHGGGLDQRRRMLDRAEHTHDARPPGRVGAGVVGRGFGRGIDRAGLNRKLRHGPPVMGLPRLGRRCGLGSPARCRLRRERLAEQIAGASGGNRSGRDRLSLRHPRDDGIEQLGGVGGARRPVQINSSPGAALQHGEAGIERGAPAGIGAAVDGHGEDAARRRVETADGVARRAMGRRDRHQPTARRQHRGGRADVAEVGVAGDAVDTGRRRKRRVHQHHGRPDVVQAVGDSLGVERRHHGLREQPGEEARPRAGVFVEVECTRRPVAQRALRHHRQHAGAGGGLQHDVARADGGGLKRGIGERQRRRELLEPDLLLGAPGVGGLQRRDHLQHRQHAARPVRTGAAGAAHAAAVALHEEHHGRFGSLIGVLPDPAALGVRRAEYLRHGVPERLGVEGPSGLQHRQQGLGRGEQGVARDRAGRFRGRVDGDGGRKRTRKGVRRLLGVEHGRSPCWKGGGGRTARVLPRRPRRTAPGRLAGLPPAQGAAGKPGASAARTMRSGRCGRAGRARAAQGRRGMCGGIRRSIRPRP